MHGLRFAGQERLVDFESVRAGYRAVDDDLEAGAHLEEIVGHDLVDGDTEGFPIAHDACFWCVQQRELVERLAGPKLLNDADHRVRHDDRGEHGILGSTDREDEDEQDADYCVDACEDVRPEDLAQGANRRVGDDVAASIGNALAYLSVAETVVVRGDHGGIRRGRHCRRAPIH
ncbi:unannotated protein [freshwater metagenome]|uniref:Unannotated protein n=1 Tax=freshwater metagenome TaxID=449393 RepID=A0A6J7JDL8_9ZZZZ